jgi:hypothetical protein
VTEHTQIEEAFTDIGSHRACWLQALEAARDHASRTREPDDAAFWRHEISAFHRTMDALTRAANLRPSMVAALEAAAEYFDTYADVVDSEDGEQTPNIEMSLLTEIQAALRATPAQSSKGE